jgi:hypothetical protein
LHGLQRGVCIWIVEISQERHGLRLQGVYILIVEISRKEHMVRDREEFASCLLKFHGSMDWDREEFAS